MRHLSVPLSLLPALLSGCFNPLGNSTDSNASTGGPTSTAETTTPTSGPTSTAETTTAPTSGPTTTDGTSGSTTLDLTGSTTLPDLTSTSVITETTGFTTLPDTDTLGPPVCGNGITEPGEECDDGDNVDNNDCTNACENAVCGDGILQIGVEECDDGNVIDNDGCSVDCKYEALLVFLSSSTFSADALVPAAADSSCDALGKAKFPGRNFVAWISTGLDPAEQRMGVSLRPYTRPDGTVLANNKTELLDGTLLAPINVTEQNLIIGGADENMACPPKYGVWTGTLTNGTGSLMDCDTWMSTEFRTMGTVGSFVKTDATWTYKCDMPCSFEHRIYCVQTVL